MKKPHLTRAKRKQVRTRLLNTWGDRCCWCGGKMEIPEYGKPLKNLTEMATIEHYFAKLFGDISCIILFRLSHRKCNK